MEKKIKVEYCSIKTGIMDYCRHMNDMILFAITKRNRAIEKRMQRINMLFEFICLIRAFFIGCSTAFSFLLTLTMGCQTSIAFGCIILLTSSTLFFYLYFGVYLRYKFITSGSHDSVIQVAIAFMCICIFAFVITLLLILRCLMKPNRGRTVSPMQGLKKKEGDVQLSSVVVTSPNNRIISSKKFKTRVSSPPNHPDIPEEVIPHSKPAIISSEKLDKEVNSKTFIGSGILNKIGINNLSNLGKEINFNNKNNTPAAVHVNSKITGKDNNILNNGTTKEVKAEINNAGKDIINNSKEIKTGAKDVLNSSKGAIKLAKPEVKDTVDKTKDILNKGNVMKGAAIDIKTGAKDVLNTSKETIKEVKPEVKDTVDKTKDILNKSDGVNKGAAIDTKAGVKDVLNTSKGAIKEVKPEVKDVVDKSKDILNKSNGIKGAAIDIKTGAKDVLNTSKGAIKEVKAEVDKSKDILNKSNGMKGSVADTTTGVKDVLNTSKGAIKEVKTEVKDAADKSKDILNKSNGMKEAVIDTKTGAKDVLNTSKAGAIKEIKSEAKDTPSTSKDILNKSNGMKGAVIDTKSAIINAAGTVKDALNTSKEGIKDTANKGQDILNKSNEKIKGIMKDTKSDITNVTTATGKDLLNSSKDAAKGMKSGINDITNNSGKDILNANNVVKDIKAEIPSKEVVNKSSQTEKELKAQMNNIAVGTDDINKNIDSKEVIKTDNNNVTGKEARLDNNNLKVPIKTSLVGGVLPGKKPGFTEIELVSPSNVSPISDKKLYINNPTSDIKTLKENCLKNDNIKKAKLELQKVDTDKQVSNKIDGVKGDDHVVRKPESSGLNDIANAIKMGKKPGKIEVHHHHQHKKHSCVEEREKREKEKILSHFNPCFPIPKKRSSKNKKEEKEKKVEPAPSKPAPIKLPGKNALGPFKKKAKTATAFNTAFVVKQKSAKKVKPHRIEKSKSPKPFNKSSVKKLNNNFTVTDNSARNKTSSKLNETMDSSMTNPMTVQKAMKLDDTFTLKEKSANKEKRTNILGNTVVIEKPSTYEKGGNAIFSVVKNTAEYEMGKAATKMVMEKVGKTEVLNKTSNLLEVPKVDVGKSSDLIGKIKEDEAKKIGVNNNTTMSEIVLLHEVGKGKEKLGYWGWNYEYWS